MLFKVAPKIAEIFPGLKIGVIVAKNIVNNTNQEFAHTILKNQQIKLNQSLDLQSLLSHPFIKSWQEAYKKFGMDPKDYTPSVEALSRRVLKSGSFNSVNTLVDIYNYISIKYLLPLGAEDLDKIKGNLELTFATENDKSVLLLGQKEPSKAKVGEVIYKDDEGIICRSWNWREAERTMVTPDSKNVVLVLEGLDAVPADVVKAATYELAYLVKKYCSGDIYCDFVDNNHLEFNLKNLKQFDENLFKEAQYNIYELKLGSIEHHESKEFEIRAQKAQKLEEIGINPWPENKEINSHSEIIKKEFTGEEGKEYIIAGRLMTIRSHGKSIFANLQDQSGMIQIYIKQDKVGHDQFELFNNFVDTGDIVWVKGTVFKTKTLEITLNVSEFTLLSKCLRPLPEKFHGLTDVETKYRQRYLDLMTSSETKERFIKRSAILKTIRNFLDSHGYIEVETPMLHPIAGGAAARPFITHHNALSSDFYLRIAPELYLKRLVVGGFERVYEINRNFRNEGVSTKHNPEFTMIEFYTAYEDYHFSMTIVENLIRKAAQEASGSLQLPYGTHTIDFEKPFTRISIKDAVKLHANLNDADVEQKNIDSTLKKLGIKITDQSVNEKIYKIFDEVVEAKLIEPTFIIDFPIEVSPLSKRDAMQPDIAARFELFISGMEIANSYNELNDPFDQAQRFKDQLKAFEAGDQEAHQYDADYVLALEYGLPPTVGVGIGIDRLVMLLTNTTSIKEVILFPTLKKKV